MKKVILFVNDEAVFDFDKEMTLDENQLSFLGRMDSDMDKGIKIQGELITEPNTEQRAVFISMNLIKALQQENDAAVSSSSAYLMNRLPALNEIRVNDHGSRVNVEFIEEQIN